MVKVYCKSEPDEMKQDHCQLITRANPSSVVLCGLSATVPRLCLSVWYHSCLLGCTVDHSDNRFLQRGPFHFSSLEWMDCRLRRETQGHFSSKCHCTRKSLVMSTFLYSIVCLCGCCGAPRSSHIPPNQTVGVVLKQLKTSCFSSQSLEQW